MVFAVYVIRYICKIYYYNWIELLQLAHLPINRKSWMIARTSYKINDTLFTIAEGDWRQWSLSECDD